MMPPEDPNMIEPEESAPPLADESIYPCHHPEHPRRSKYLAATLVKYRYYLINAGILIVLIIALSIGLAKNGGGGGSETSQSSAVPPKGHHPHDPPVIDVPVVEPTPEIPSDTGVDVVETRMKNLLSRLLSIYKVLEFPENYPARFENADSPQFRALKWVCSQPAYDSFDDARRIQRFVLASFFYSTYAVKNAYVTSQIPWTSASLWLSDEHECTWEGITCHNERNPSDGNQAEQVVEGINLKQHRLSGAVPRDLALLRESLTSLVLTNNLLYMEGGDINVLRHLDNLKTLMLDDNYIVDHYGIPSSIKHLAKLEKLVLSYNLLQGTIPNDFFNGMTKLSHLEIESNYLSGTLPISLAHLQSLVYLYMRRNEFHIPLQHDLRRAKWSNLFSLWLDHNNVTGNFPTEIGQLASVASLSITNTSLVGTIPTELGLITGLRRAWFYGNELTGRIPSEVGDLSKLEVLEVYGNELTGPMPTGVCDSVNSATYEFKQLSADCHKVHCRNCCTTCY